MEFLPEEITAYAERFTRPEGHLLSQINRDTNAEVLYPRMLSGHLQGQALRMFSLMIRPRRILEIGTYTGYSALCLADGLTQDGIIHTIDINDELEKRVRRYFEQSEHGEKIRYHIGDALKIIPALDEVWDLVLIDADKTGYAAYFDLAVPKLRHGGFIIADNVLWSGHVLEKGGDADTLAIKSFNVKVNSDPRVENVLFPIRDGLMVMRKP